MKSLNNFKDLTFTSADVVKLIGFVSMLGSVWLDLRIQNAQMAASQEVINYRISVMEKKIFAEIANNSRLLSDNK